METEQLTDETKPDWRAVVREYGGVFFAILVTLWSAEWAFWTAAILFGVPVERWLSDWGVPAAENGQFFGVLMVALAITQVTKPPRIAFTAFITPMLARPFRRWRAARMGGPPTP